MKLVIDARAMGSRPGGIGVYLYNFLKELIEYDDFQAVLVTDVAESEHIRYFLDRNIKVHCLGTAIYRSTGVYKYFDYVQKVLDEEQPDVFWEVNNIIPVKLRGNFKVVVTIHDVFPLTHTECYGRVYKWYFTHAMKKTLKQADGIVFDSVFSRESTYECFKQAKTIPCTIGYIIMKQMEDKPAVSDKGYFLYVGNMERRKGVDILLEGYSLYRKAGGDKSLILAGKAPEEDIKALIDDAVKKDVQVTYLNYVTEDKKKELFAGCSAFVFPSRAEGFGMPVLEAMEYGKPVVASDLAIFREVAGDGLCYFDVEAQGRGLADSLADYSKADMNTYEEICNRYKKEILGKNLYDFLDGIADR